MLCIGALVQPCSALKCQIDGIGISRTFCSCRLGDNELCAQHKSEPRHDLVLHIEEIGNGSVKPVRPKMIGILPVNELYVDPKSGPLR